MCPVPHPSRTGVFKFSNYSIMGKMLYFLLSLWVASPLQHIFQIRKCPRWIDTPLSRCILHKTHIIITKWHPYINRLLFVDRTGKLLKYVNTPAGLKLPEHRAGQGTYPLSEKLQGRGLLLGFVLAKRVIYFNLWDNRLVPAFVRWVFPSKDSDVSSDK